jgi:hypothetical protein
MRSLVLSLCALLASSCSLAAFDRSWIGGSSSNWFDSANWDPVGVPAATESVRITNFTTIVLTDAVVVASLELRRATLVVSNQLTVTNLLVSDGAWLNAWQTRPSPIANPSAGSGIVEIPLGGRLQIGDTNIGFAFGMEGTRLNLRGSGICTNRTGILPFFRSEFNVYGSLVISQDFVFDSANGPPNGSLNVYGTVQCSTPSVIFGTTYLTNRGTILAQSGIVLIGNGVNSGVMNTSFGATQNFVGTFEWQRGGIFMGGGTVRMTRGTFNCGTNDLLVPNIYLASPGMTIQGTNTIRLTDTLWELGDFAGSGEVIASSHLNTVAAPPGTRGKTFHGTRRLVNRGKANLATNDSIAFLDRSSFRNEGFLTLLPNAGLYGLATAAPHPDVSLLNLGTLHNGLQSTNEIWIRVTNSGTIQVDGQLRFAEPNSVQNGGVTAVSGSFSVFRDYRIFGGLLTGTGRVETTIRNSGTITPGGSIGRLSVQGSMTNSGRLFIDLGYDGVGSTADLLTVSDHFRLGGSVGVNYSGSGWPPEGTQWEILQFGSSSGAFGRLDGLDLGGGHILLPLFSPTNLVLVLSNQPPRQAFLNLAQSQPNQLRIQFTGEPDTTYTIDASDNLVSWIPLLQTNRPDGVISFLENPGLPRRFYRVSRAP